MDRFVLTSGRVNRYGYRLLPEGGQLQDYEANPVLLWNHNGNIMSVGKVKDIRLEDGKLTGEPEFDMEDDVAKDLARKYVKGYQRGFSIWHDPIETSEDPSVLVAGQTRATVTKWDLLEVSVVNVQGDAGAHKLSGDKMNNIDSVIPKLSLKKEDKMSLEKINKKLGLSSDSTEDEAIEAIGKLRSQLAAAETEKVSAFIERGRKLSLINDENEKDWERIAKSDYDTALNIMNTQAKEEEKKDDKEGKETLDAKLSDMLKKVRSQNDAGGSDDEETFEKLSKENPEKLREIQKNDPERYEKLAKEYDPK